MKMRIDINEVALWIGFWLILVTAVTAGAFLYDVLGGSLELCVFPDPKVSICETNLSVEEVKNAVQRSN